MSKHNHGLKNHERFCSRILALLPAQKDVNIRVFADNELNGHKGSEELTTTGKIDMQNFTNSALLIRGLVDNEN